MEDKYQLVFSSKQLEILDYALWGFISGFKYDTYKISDADFDNFIDSISAAYRLRKYIRSNFDQNED